MPSLACFMDATRDFGVVLYHDSGGGLKLLTDAITVRIYLLSMHYNILKK